jgi:hypothetical protein
MLTSDLAMLSTIRIKIRSLAAGIGVNTAVCSLVDALFLRPPEVRDPYARLVYHDGMR